MSDPRMDPYEAIAYGRFTAAQIHTLLLGLDPELDASIKLMAGRVASASDALEVALLRSGEPALLLHRSPEGQPDPVHAARETLRDLLHYAASCRDGYTITSRLLQGESLSTVLRRTPMKLIGRLEHARYAIERMDAMLPEREKWMQLVDAAREDLERFDAEVHAARASRRVLSSECAQTWGTWQRTYASAKYVVIGLLAGCDKVPLVREVFDDLADECPARLSQLPLPPSAV